MCNASASNGGSVPLRSDIKGTELPSARRTDGQTDRQTDGIAVASTELAMRALRRAVKTAR